MRAIGAAAHKVLPNCKTLRGRSGTLEASARPADAGAAAIGVDDVRRVVDENAREVFGVGR